MTATTSIHRGTSFSNSLYAASARIAFHSAPPQRILFVGLLDRRSKVS
jgi:hypothetical protein